MYTKYFAWYRGRHFWTRDYFCVISGELTQTMIEEYLEHHFEPKV
ncbi:transposase [Vibrio sp.]